MSERAYRRTQNGRDELLLVRRAAIFRMRWTPFCDSFCAQRHRAVIAVPIPEGHGDWSFKVRRGGTFSNLDLKPLLFS